MKINYKNTALELLHNMHPRAFTIIGESKDMAQEYATQVGLSIVQNWPLIADRFKEKIRYISDPFYAAYTKACSKLSGVIDAEEIDESGTFVMRASASETNTIFYDIRTEGKGQDFKIIGVVFIFNNDTKKERPGLAIYVQRNNKGIKEYLSKNARENEVTNITVLADILTMILFLKYCETETKVIEAGKKGYHVNCKYLNETKQKIEVLDSTWFTTIVRSEGFTVGAETGGFWRLQVCGKDLADRKLKWILPFEKEGYTRKAKVLIHEDGNRE